MKRLAGLTASLLLVPLSMQVTAKEWSLSAGYDGFAHSESLPAWSVIDKNWQGPLTSNGQQAFGYHRWGLTAAYGDWSVSLLHRYDFAAEYAPDTAELIYRESNDIALDERVYPISLDLSLLKAHGVGLGYRFALSPDIQLGVYPQLWLATEILSGYIRGDVSVANDSFQAALETRYHYVDDLLFERDVAPVTGLGGSLDLSLDWQLAANWQLSLAAADVLNRFSWTGLPVTQAIADTDNGSLDEHGNISYQPAISGKEGYQDYLLRLPAYYRAELSWQRPGYQLQARARYQHEQFFPELAINRAGWQLGYLLGGKLHGQAVRLGYRNRYLSAELTTSHWQLDKAGTVSAGLTLTL